MQSQKCETYVSTKSSGYEKAQDHRAYSGGGGLKVQCRVCPRRAGRSLGERAEAILRMVVDEAPDLEKRT